MRPCDHLMGSLPLPVKRWAFPPHPRRGHKTLLPQTHGHWKPRAPCGPRFTAGNPECDVGLLTFLLGGGPESGPRVGPGSGRLVPRSMSWAVLCMATAGPEARTPALPSSRPGPSELPSPPREEPGAHPAPAEAAGRKLPPRGQAGPRLSRVTGGPGHRGQGPHKSTPALGRRLALPIVPSPPAPHSWPGLQPQIPAPLEAGCSP